MNDQVVGRGGARHDIKAIETRYKGYRLRSKLPIRAAQNKMQARADLTGKTFNRLLVKETLGVDGRGFRFWGCECACGEKIVVNSRELLRSHTGSCGCIFLENLRSKGGWNRLLEGESALNQFFYSYKRSARFRGHEFQLTLEQFKDISQKNCHYCGSEPEIKFKAVPGTNGSYHGNGIDRMDNSQGYSLGNVVPCCTQCNIAKGVLTVDVFKVWALRLAASFEHGESGAM